MRVSALVCVVVAVAVSLHAAPAPEPEPAIGAVLGALAFGGGLLLGAKVFGGGYGYGYDDYGYGGCNCGCGGCGGHCGWCGGNFGGGYGGGHGGGHHGGGHHGGGHHGGGHHGGGCGGYGGCGRRKRSIEEFMAKPAMHHVYEKLAVEDTERCGMKLVCELAQKDPRDLAQDEIQILLPYRGVGESDGTVYGHYDEAAWHGQEGHSCPDTYPLCDLNSQQMMNFLHQMDTNTTTTTTTL